MSTLPADSEIEGNVWCEDCQQSLSASRASAHLASKKHADNVGAVEAKAPPKKTTGGKAPARKPAPAAREEEPQAPPKKRAPKKKPVEEEYSSEEEEEAPRAKKVVAKKAPSAVARREASSLPADPEKEGNLWCGLCNVSLTPTKAEAHLDTKRHQDNAMRTVKSAMRNTKLADSADD